MEPLSPYQRRLLVFLSVATFFEGYDFVALAQILPNLRSEMGLSPSQGGVLVAVINFGTILAYLLVRQADRWGRRRVMTVTIVGYTVCSLLTAAANSAYTFGAAQLLARVFLIGEWATAMVYAAEEFPAERRASMIGVIQAMASLGAIFVAAIVPTLMKAPTGWRTVYIVGAVPLVIIAFARRTLKESARYEREVANRTIDPSFFRIFKMGYTRRVFQLALIWALTYVCTQNAVTFWKEFATAERNLSDAQVGTAVAIGAVGSLPLVFGAGKLLDVVGRKIGAAIIFTITSIGVAGAFSFHSQGLLTFSLAFTIAGVSAVLPVLNSYTAELFPTELRSDAFAWANNLLGRIGYVVSPLLVGQAAELYGWGPSLASTAIFPMFALVLILLLLPETKGLDLDETAKV